MQTRPARLKYAESTRVESGRSDDLAGPVALALLCIADAIANADAHQLAAAGPPSQLIVGKWREVSQNGSPVSPGAVTCQYFPDHSYVCNGQALPAPFHSTWAIPNPNHIRLGSGPNSLCILKVSGSVLVTQCRGGQGVTTYIRLSPPVPSRTNTPTTTPTSQPSSTATKPPGRTTPTPTASATASPTTTPTPAPTPTPTRANERRK